MLRSSVMPSSISLFFHALFSPLSQCRQPNVLLSSACGSDAFLCFVRFFLARSFSPAIYMTRGTWVASATSSSLAMPG
ncbi:hypothetical protein BDZ97DRAFT_1435146 [Flammula alnicola]|nr:hypothetical protein BDZ97DRAFT_1435146 [Flammula alnicola]